MADPTEDPIWTAHEGCDQRIAELEADVTRLQAIASVAGDLWNELENCREFWSEKPLAPLVEECIARYEALAEGEPHG